MNDEAKNLELTLVSKLRAGDEEAYIEVLERFQHTVFTLAGRICGSAADAEEVTQDVFLTVFRKIGEFEAKCAFSSWIYRITVNCSLMSVRKKKRNVVKLQSAADIEFGLSSGQSIETLVSQKEIIARTEEIVHSLPEEIRAVFVLRDIHGFTGIETAEMLELTASTVKSRLHRARMLMRSRMKSAFGVFHDAGGLSSTSKGVPALESVAEV